MEVITLHKCQRCGKVWFPRTSGQVCPTCKTGEPKAQNLLSSVSGYMGRMRQERAKSNQHIITNSAIKEH